MSRPSGFDLEIADEDRELLATKLEYTVIAALFNDARVVAALGSTKVYDHQALPPDIKLPIIKVQTPTPDAPALGAYMFEVDHGWSTVVLVASLSFKDALAIGTAVLQAVVDADYVIDDHKVTMTRCADATIKRAADGKTFLGAVRVMLTVRSKADEIKRLLDDDHDVTITGGVITSHPSDHTYDH